jgi:hypothetical protein
MLRVDMYILSAFIFLSSTTAVRISSQVLLVVVVVVCYCQRYLHTTWFSRASALMRYGAVVQF